MNKNSSGYIILEILLAIVIFTMIMLSMFSMVSFVQRRTVASKYEADAITLLQEGMEVAHSSLLSNWDEFADNTYSPAYNSSKDRWTLVEGEEIELQTRFTRSIKLTRVCRNPENGERLEAVSAGCGLSGDLDPNSRVVTTTLTWNENQKEKRLEADLLIYKSPTI